MGQTRTWTRTFTRADGTSQSVTFTVKGRAKAPTGVFFPPTLTHHTKMVKAVQRGADTYAAQLITIDKGLPDGWPHPFTDSVMEFSADGTTGWAPHPKDIGVHDLYIPAHAKSTPDWPVVGHYRLRVTYRNTMGAHTVDSNTLQILQSGADIQGETWNFGKPALLPEAA